MYEIRMEIFNVQQPRKRMFANLREMNMKYAPVCPVCGRAGNRLIPLSVGFKDSNPLGDFLWLVPDIFVSQKAKDVLEMLKSEDFEFTNVIINGARYYERIYHLNITARCSIASECGVQLLEKCNECGREFYSTWYGRLLIDKKCDSSIFRLVEHPGMIFFNEIVVDIIQQNHLTNIAFIPSEEVTDELAWMRPRK